MASLSVGLRLVLFSTALLAACAPAAAPAPTAGPAKPTEAAKPAPVAPAPAPAAAPAASPAVAPAASPAAAQPASAKPAAPADLAAVYEEAKKEKSVVFYTTVPVENIPRVKEAFEKKYPGVQLETFRGTGTSLSQKFETEYRANQHNADLFQTAIMEPVLRYQADGWLMAYDSPEAASYPANAKDKDWWSVGISVTCVGYNTNQLKGADVPKDYDAMLDPKFKGRVGTIPPWASGNGLEFNYFMTFERKMADWGLKFAAQEPKLFNNFAEVAQGVIRGEVALAAPMAEYEANNNRKQGAPVDCVFPESGVTANSRPMFIPKSAPRPNAARLLLNWLLSTEGQQVIQDNIGWRSVRPGMPAIEGLPSTDKLKIWYADPKELGARQKDFVDTWQKLFGR